MLPQARSMSINLYPIQSGDINSLWGCILHWDLPHFTPASKHHPPMMAVEQIGFGLVTCIRWAMT